MAEDPCLRFLQRQCAPVHGLRHVARGRWQIMDQDSRRESLDAHPNWRRRLCSPFILHTGLRGRKGPMPERRRFECRCRLARRISGIHSPNAIGRFRPQGHNDLRGLSRHRLPWRERGAYGRRMGLIRRRIWVWKFVHRIGCGNDESWRQHRSF